MKRAVDATNNGLADRMYAKILEEKRAAIGLDQRSLAGHPREVMGGRGRQGQEPARTGYGEMTIYMKEDKPIEQTRLEELLENLKELRSAYHLEKKGERETAEHHSNKMQAKYDELDLKEARLERELKNLPVVPKMQNRFQDGHSDLSGLNPNTIMHIRYDTRIDEKGNPVLHVAEIQGDWGSKYSRQRAREIKNEKVRINVVQDALAIHEIAESFTKMSYGRTSQGSGGEFFEQFLRKAIGVVGIAKDPYYNIHDTSFGIEGKHWYDGINTSEVLNHMTTKFTDTAYTADDIKRVTDILNTIKEFKN